MLNKLYLAVLGVSIAVMAFLTFYAWSWLQSIGDPAAALAGYQYHAAMAWPILWISAATLLMLGNAVLWTSGRAWALWSTFIYFAVTVLVRNFGLDRAFVAFNLKHSFTDGSFSAAPLFAAMLVIFAAAVVFADQILVTRLCQPTYIEPVETPPAD